MARPRRIGDALTFGGRLPWAIGLVISILVVLSLLFWLGERHLGSLFEVVSLAPADVWRGQVWRLATWPFIEPEPFALIFACLSLYWFGRDLADGWGSIRFLAVFGGVALAAAAGTCLIARLDPAVLGQRYLGGWALTTAMVVAWGLWFPQRVVRIYFVLPITGTWLAWLTVAVTAAFAVYEGWEGYLPQLFAEASILGWLFRRSLLARWSAARAAAAARRHEARRAKRRNAAVTSLHLVAHEDDELPPEIEDQLRNIFKGKQRPR